MDINLTWLSLGIVWLVGFIASVALRRRVDRSHWIAWDATLTAEAEGYAAYMDDVLRSHAGSAVDLVALAETRAAQAGDSEARPVLTGLFEVVPRFTQSGRATLREWSVASRVREAYGPVPLAALPMCDLRSSTLRALATGHALADHVALTAGERFRLRLLVLRWAYAAVGLAARRGAREVTASPRPSIPVGAWRRARLVTHDLSALADEAVHSARPILALLHAHQSRKRVS